MDKLIQENYKEPAKAANPPSKSSTRNVDSDDCGRGERHRRDARFGPSDLRLGTTLREAMVIAIEPRISLIPPLCDCWERAGIFLKPIDADAGEAQLGLTCVGVEGGCVITTAGATRLGSALAP